MKDAWVGSEVEQWSSGHVKRGITVSMMANKEAVQGLRVAMGDRKLKVAMVYGEFSSGPRKPFGIARLEDESLTGSESSFFNLARSLAELGHQVVLFCKLGGDAGAQHPSGFVAVSLDAIPSMAALELDAVLAWNEPDYLRFAPPGALRVVDQQLNDWGYCRPCWQEHVDVFVFPSRSSRDDNHMKQIDGPLTNEASEIIPNSVDLALFTCVDEPPCIDSSCPYCFNFRHPHRVVYCSSPDRGLHHLLAMWPSVRARVPDAELKIFYRVQPWLDRSRDMPGPLGHRARFVEECLRRMATDWGVEVVGPVPNREMARQLRSATVLAYPCDPVSYTEGFGVSVLDACAAGCLPIISDADALAEVHGGAACVLGGKHDRATWAEAIIDKLNCGHSISPEMREHAEAHSRQAVTDAWEKLLLSAKRRA